MNEFSNLSNLEEHGNEYANESFDIATMESGLRTLTEMLSRINNKPHQRRHENHQGELNYYIFLIIVVDAAIFDAVLERTSCVAVIQAVQICWFYGNGIGAIKCVSQLGN